MKRFPTIWKRFSLVNRRETRDTGVQNQVATSKLIVGIDTGDTHTHATLPVFLSRDANPCWPGARISHPKRGSLSWPGLRVRTRQGSRDPCLDCRISGATATPFKPLGKHSCIRGRTLGGVPPLSSPLEIIRSKKAQHPRLGVSSNFG